VGDREAEQAELARGLHPLPSASMVLGFSGPPATFDARGLPLHCVQQSGAARGAPSAPDAACVHALDHVVIDTSEPDAVIALYRDALQIRLALDRDFPERAARLLFFRVGGVTLYFACRGSPAGAGDRFYGLAYRVQDAQAAHARLHDAGFELGALRDGNKRGTRVFTVKDDTHGVPTLVLSDRART
jgi:catechol 2,3-dioxygenase-like lactoylglutathione lyase family enzyme